MPVRRALVLTLPPRAVEATESVLAYAAPVDTLAVARALEDAGAALELDADLDPHTAHWTGVFLTTRTRETAIACARPVRTAAMRAAALWTAEQ